jgi:hypothetical protein
LLRGRCDGPLALLELLGLWRLRHLDQLLCDKSLILRTNAQCWMLSYQIVIIELVEFLRWCHS